MKKRFFRGKRLDNGEWVIGYYVEDEQGASILYQHPADGSLTRERVDPETVSQYTGKDDCNENHIFGGDIVKEKEHGIIFLIEWSDESLCYFIKTLKGGRDYLCDIWDCEVIGNRWDNPELLEAQK